ncbi:hypothetical protein A7982_13952 [Minicystis rosea]|nr:hypothetical protein A7982_13952 [Minicystis rosea]
MWLVGLVSPLYFYVLPFFYVLIFGREDAPWVEWSHQGAFPSSYPIVGLCAIASIVVPTVWHHRSLVRLRLRTTIVPDPRRPGSYRGAPGALTQIRQPELAARAAVLRYAQRLAMALVLLSPIYFVAWREAHIIVAFHVPPPRIVPVPEDYLPMAVVVSLFVAWHFPTTHRVFGALDVWGRVDPSIDIRADER